jgi:hypothetical protein
MNDTPEFEQQNTIVESSETEQVTQTTTQTTSEAESPAEVSAPIATTATTTTTTTVDRKVRGGMFGVTETIVFGLSCLVLLSVLGFYFLIVAPAQRDLKAKKERRDEQEIKLKNLQTKYKDVTKTEEFVSTLEQSVSDFEFRYLPIASIGQSNLYDRLNGLIYAYHLRNTSGPSYQPLEIVTQKNGQPREERGKNKFQTLFPGVYINMTVEGTYPNLRRFIGEIESSQQFVIISAVELQAAENKEEDTRNTQAAGPQGPSFDPKTGMPLPAKTPLPTGPKGKTLGEVVSLNMELAAYFRREGAAAQPPAAPAVR